MPTTVTYRDRASLEYSNAHDPESWYPVYDDAIQAAVTQAMLQGIPIGVVKDGYDLEEFWNNRQGRRLRDRYVILAIGPHSTCHYGPDGRLHG